LEAKDGEDRGAQRIDVEVDEVVIEDESRLSSPGSSREEWDDGSDSCLRVFRE
jgi:hypothetical protein